MHGVSPRRRDDVCRWAVRDALPSPTPDCDRRLNVSPAREPGTAEWWRRWELNPRPQALRHRIYVRVQPIDLAACYPAGGENTRPAPERFSGTRPEHAGPAIL